MSFKRFRKSVSLSSFHCNSFGISKLNAHFTFGIKNTKFLDHIWF
ncbi:hypothetical protein LEP1GSC172_2989 [Leptospira noguchii]|uniref:Uncharacterized protein n=1 Tax=Leptospira noguchii TaxID=28182 RepID=M6V742_9LEPT|nr:hypothetical protein LEP1GSC172_2989 [Leptospira noguchii]